MYAKLLQDLETIGQSLTSHMARSERLALAGYASCDTCGQTFEMIDDIPETWDINCPECQAKKARN